MIKVQSINLYNDWVQNSKYELQAKGYTFTGNDNEKISIQHYNYLKRVIPAKPRQIKKSDIFTCPENLTSGLAFLENKILTGQDILPHLSRKLKNLDEIDDLLYDWGIFHIHLGETIENDGYINRTGPLLFGYYDEENFYFLNIMSHGSWSRQIMLKTIHRNWPQTIEDYLIKDKNIVGLSHNVTDAEIAKLRKANINVLIEVEPTVIYVTPGGGFASSGHSMEVIRRYMDNRENLETFEKQIKSDPEKFLNSIYENNLSFLTNNNLSFKLIKKNNKNYLHELNNNLEIELNQ